MLFHVSAHLRLHVGSDPRPDRVTLLGGLRHSLPLRETHLSGMAGGLSFGCTPPAPSP